MKYNSIIIGGGLSGLLAGIRLAKAGQKVAIISSGQSALHFSSGSFGLLGSVDGHSVTNPVEGIKNLPAVHPYSKVGAEKVISHAAEVKNLLSEAGLTFKGDATANHYHLTPIGRCRPAWLTLDDYATCEDLAAIKWKKVAIINFKGYLDFYPEFIADELKKKGIVSVSYTLSLPDLERLRKSSSEMRATAIAKYLKGDNLDLFATEINRVLTPDIDMVLIPAVVGLDSEKPLVDLRSKVKAPLSCVPVIPMSVGGLRCQMALRRYFESLGGVYFLGDSVSSGYMKAARMVSVETVNLAPVSLFADNFILATGSFFSHGLVAEPHKVVEPVFNLDVRVPSDRDEWFRKNLFEAQPFMEFGVDTDPQFRVKKDGKVIENVYAAGAILGGCNPLKEESGAGVATVTALEVADLILNQK